MHAFAKALVRLVPCNHFGYVIHFHVAWKSTTKGGSVKPKKMKPKNLLDLLSMHAHFSVDDTLSPVFSRDVLTALHELALIVVVSYSIPNEAERKKTDEEAST